MILIDRVIADSDYGSFQGVAAGEGLHLVISLKKTGQYGG